MLASLSTSFVELDPILYEYVTVVLLELAFLTSMIM